MAHVVILGAGLTGLSTAYHLEAQGFFDYVIVEKEQSPGGLCRSVRRDGFTFDYAGHFLHINDHSFESFITQVIGLATFNNVIRKSFIYSHDTYTPYPFQVNLHGLPPDVIADCIEGFVQRPTRPSACSSYYNWVLNTFGLGFGKHFFFPYQSKIFAYDLHKLTNSWMGRFVPGTSLRQIIHGALTPPDHTAIGYNATFWYPRAGGIDHLVQTLTNTLINPIKTGHAVNSIDLRTKTITCANGHEEPFTVLVNTMPLDLCLGMLKEPASSSLHSAQRHLVCNSVVNFNLGVAREQLTDKNWVYYPEAHVPFFRLGFPHTCSTAMAPHGYSSVAGEWAHINASAKAIEQTTHHAITYAQKTLGLRTKEIVFQHILHLQHAYVIYNTWRDRNIDKLLTRLQEHAVYSIGRYGGWKYSSMQEAITDGMHAAAQILATPISPSKKLLRPHITHPQRTSV